MRVQVYIPAKQNPDLSLLKAKLIKQVESGMDAT